MGGFSVNKNQNLKSSTLGVASFAVAIASVGFLALMFISAMCGGNGGISPILFFILSIVATIMAAVDLTRPDRKRILSVLAIIVPWGTFFLMIIIAFAIFYFIKLKMRL